MRAQLKGITDGLVKEKKTRIANEKQIVADIDRECKQMHTDIDNEKASRKQRLQDLDDMLTQDMTRATARHASSLFVAVRPHRGVRRSQRGQAADRWRTIRLLLRCASDTNRQGRGLACLT
mgnify:CR=1 FL=1